MDTLAAQTHANADDTSLSSSDTKPLADIKVTTDVQVKSLQNEDGLIKGNAAYDGVRSFLTFGYDIVKRKNSR
jgi:hypothetical protein